MPRGAPASSDWDHPVARGAPARASRSIVKRDVCSSSRKRCRRSESALGVSRLFDVGATS